MRRAVALFIALIVALVFVPALSGCSEPPRGVIVWHPYRGAEQKALEKIAERFEAERNVKVTLRPSSRDEPNRSSSTMARTPPPSARKCPFSRTRMPSSIAIFGEPRNVATNFVRGLSYTSSGAPFCSTSPPLRTHSVSARVMAST